MAPSFVRRGMGAAPTVAELRAALSLNQEKLGPATLLSSGGEIRRRSVVVAALAATDDAGDIVIFILIVLEEGVVVIVVIDIHVDIIHVDIVVDIGREFIAPHGVELDVAI